MDLFDGRGDIKRGKWKCPFYETPTDTNVKTQDIKHLQLIPLAWIYLRLSYPTDDVIAEQQSLYPENTKTEYIIPQIHIRLQQQIYRLPQLQPQGPSILPPPPQVQAHPEPPRPNIQPRPF